jgi:F-type H+-transporting ATPase subunit alpha
LEAFAKFGSEMDAVTAMVIDKGRKNTQLLVQPLHQPIPVEKQIAILYCGTNGLLAEIPLNKVQEFEKQFLVTLESMHRSDVLDLLKEGIINDEITAIIEKVAKNVCQSLLVR